MITVPTSDQETDILASQKLSKKREKMELAADEDAGDDFEEEEQFDREENINIKNALQWKRKHFFVMCIFVCILLMIKLEFSYKKMFSQNIKTFLLLFMIFDLILE